MNFTQCYVSLKKNDDLYLDKKIQLIKQMFNQVSLTTNQCVACDCNLRYIKNQPRF